MGLSQRRSSSVWTCWIWNASHICPSLWQAAEDAAGDDDNPAIAHALQRFAHHVHLAHQFVLQAEGKVFVVQLRQRLESSRTGRADHPVDGPRRSKQSPYRL